MHSCWNLFCLPLTLTRPSRTKRSNVKTVRKILTFLSQADKETTDIANSFLRDILLELANKAQIDAPLELIGTGVAEPMVDQTFLHTLTLALKSKTGLLRRNQVRQQSSSNFPEVDGCISQPLVKSNRPQSITQRSWLYQFFQQCPETLLELLFQMEAVRNWSTLITTSQLDWSQPYPELPTLHPRHCSTKSGGRVRIASWNLNRFDMDKAKHPGFREALCLTVLRARISLLVLQEVAQLDAVNLIRSELNSPSLPYVKKWLAQNSSDHVFHWDVATSVKSTGTMFRGTEYAVFLYDKSTGIHIKRTYLLEPKDSNASSPLSRSLRIFSRSPCSALCTIRTERFVIVSVHLKAQGLRNSQIERTCAEVEALQYLVQAFDETHAAGTHLLIVGDFNLNPTHEAFLGLRNHGLTCLLKGNTSTTVRSTNKTELNFVETTDSPQNRISSTAYDNAWVSTSLFASTKLSSASYTGDCGVIRDGLQHPLITKCAGTGANGFVSDHCPIWFDLMIP